MKAPLEFDPRQHDYGPGSGAVRAVLATWADVDWFAATTADDSDAVALFHEHNARAHAFAPELFPQRVEARVVHGGWSEFVAWCKRVRGQDAWDWKFGALKLLARAHYQARGWCADSWARRLPELSMNPGDLVMRYRNDRGTEVVIWHGVYPRLAGLDALPREPEGDSAAFYLSYAQADTLDAIRWQLAEGHDDRSSNPYDALVRCYHAGAYPFSLDRSTVVLFRWLDAEEAGSARRA